MKRLVAILSIAGAMLVGVSPAGAGELWGTGSPDWGAGASGPGPVVFKFDTATGTITTPLSFESSNWMWISGLADSGAYLYASHNTYNTDPGSSMDTHDFKIAKVDRRTGAVLSDTSIAAFLGQTYSQTNALEFHDGNLYAVENATSGSTIRGFAIHVLLDGSGDVVGATLGAHVGNYPDCGLDYHDGLWYATSWGYTPSHKEGSIVYTSPDIMTTAFTQVGTGNSAVEGIGMIDGWEFDDAGELFAVTWYNVPASPTAVYKINTATWTATSLYDLASQLPASITSLDGLSERVVAACPSDRYVAVTGDDFAGYNDCSDPAAPCKTIQYAVDQACPADTIHVAAGTYDAPVSVDGFAGLTITGADKATTIIKPATAACWNVLTYGCARKTGVRVVNSTDVTLQNVTLDMNVVKANSIYGLFFWNSTGTVDNNIVKNLSVPDSAGGYYEIGGYYRAPDYTEGARAGITISNNVLIDTGRVGILSHDFVDMTITGNTIYKTTDDFGYAMEIGSTSTATVTGNTIYGYDTPALSDGSNSGGIYVENAFTGAVVVPLTKNVVVNDNEIYASQWALYVGNEFDGYAGNVDIALSMSGNDLHDNIDGAAVFTDEDRAAGSSVAVTGSGNTVTDNGGYGYLVYTWGDGDISVDLSGETITGHAASGIRVADFASGASASSYDVAVSLSDISDNPGNGISVDVPDATLAGATLTCNRIAGNGNGIVSANAGVLANDNSIFGNASSGIDGSAIVAGTMDATNNWWGCVTGPGGSCNAAPGSVDASPWATSVPACVPCNASTDCNDGLFCTGAESCVSSQCQAGAPPACPGDGNVCTDEVCDAQLDQCVSNPNTASCNDLVFCNGADTCSAGSCSQHAGDPCAGGPECADTCNESTSSCNDPAGVQCTDDGNVCTTNACNGSGACAASNNTLPCNDSLFCNGADACAGGSCSVHAGDPCTGGPECADACNETADNCNDPAGVQCTDDGNLCTTNACNGSGACAASNNTLPCDDGVACTLDDTCFGGSCGGADSELGKLCPWSVVVRKDPKSDKIKSALASSVEGDQCASRLVLGASSVNLGSVVATAATGGPAVRVGIDAQVSYDIVSGGGSAKGKPGVKLPYTNVAELAAGSITAKDDASGDYDLSGTHPLVASCTEAQNAYAGASAYLSGLLSDLDAGSIDLAPNGSVTLTAPVPGTTNVIDVDQIKGAPGATITLDGGGDAATALVLRVAGSMKLRSGTSIVLAGGLTADRVLIHVLGGRCSLGNTSEGAGTLLCSEARLRVGRDSVWTGALFAGAHVADIGDRVVVTYVPFQAF